MTSPWRIVFLFDAGILKHPAGTSGIYLPARSSLVRCREIPHLEGALCVSANHKHASLFMSQATSHLYDPMPHQRLLCFYCSTVLPNNCHSAFKLPVPGARDRGITLARGLGCCGRCQSLRWRRTRARNMHRRSLLTNPRIA
jgi:hypothetical protein